MFSSLTLSVLSRKRYASRYEGLFLTLVLTIRCVEGHKAADRGQRKCPRVVSYWRCACIPSLRASAGGNNAVDWLAGGKSLTYQIPALCLEVGATRRDGEESELTRSRVGVGFDTGHFATHRAHEGSSGRAGDEEGEGGGARQHPGTRAVGLDQERGHLGLDEDPVRRPREVSPYCCVSSAPLLEQASALGSTTRVSLP